MTQSPNQEILSTLSPHFEKIRECIVSAWNDFNDECQNIRHKISSRSRAAVVHDNMKYHAKRLFDGLNVLDTWRRRGFFS